VRVGVGVFLFFLENQKLQRPPRSVETSFLKFFAFFRESTSLGALATLQYRVQCSKKASTRRRQWGNSTLTLLSQSPVNQHRPAPSGYTFRHSSLEKFPTTRAVLPTFLTPVRVRVRRTRRRSSGVGAATLSVPYSTSEEIRHARRLASFHKTSISISLFANKDSKSSQSRFFHAPHQVHLSLFKPATIIYGAM
jgi:hypothetical protein